MKSLIVALTLLLLVLGVEINSALATSVSAPTQYHDNTRDAYSSDVLFKPEMLEGVGTNDWSPTCPDELRAKDTTEPASAQFDRLVTSLPTTGKLDQSTSAPGNVSPTAHKTALNDTNQVHVHRSADEAMKQGLRNATATTHIENEYNHMVDDTHQPYFDWYDIVKYVYALDRESPTPKWFEYLELVLLIAFIAHFGIHLHDFIEFDGRTYMEQVNRNDRALFKPANERNDSQDKMMVYVQRKVKTIKVATPPTHMKIHTEILATNTPLLVEEMSHQRLSHGTIEAQRRSSITKIKEMFTKDETTKKSNDHRTSIIRRVNGKGSMRWGRCFSVNRAASCPAMVR